MTSGTGETTAGRDFGRFSTLLVTLLALFFVAPLATGRPAVPVFEIAVSLVLVSGVYAVSRRPRVLWAGLALAASAITFEWASQLTGLRWVWLLSYALTSCFFAFVLVAIFATVLRSRRVTADTIFGGICIYLLFGAFFFELYNLIELLAPGSFLHGGDVFESFGADPLRAPALMYFSYVTLTTLGYGDVVPARDAARVVAVAEAMLGQLYVAIFVARLVALYVAQAPQREGD